MTPYSSPLGRLLGARFDIMPIATPEQRVAYLDALYQLGSAMQAHETRLRSYSEGWGEYASDLAGEMGMYADPYDRAGRLSMEHVRCFIKEKHRTK